MPHRRVCLVGAGFISHVHAEALKAIPGITLSAVVDPNLEAATSLASKWGIAKAYGSIDEALQAGSFDCAHVVVPPALHAAVGIKLLKAGIPVLLEKPLAVNHSEFLYLLLEKDFKCIDVTLEDQSDYFDNPEKTC